MTISQMIVSLEKMKKEHGDCLVFFDCPDCLASFQPKVLVTKALHLTADKGGSKL